MLADCFVLVLDGGYFDHCKVMIPASGAAAAFEADCATTTRVVYSNNPLLNRLTLEWQAQWDLPPDTPNLPSHVNASRPGIISSEVVLRLTNAGKLNCTSIVRRIVSMANLYEPRSKEKKRDTWPSRCFQPVYSSFSSRCRWQVAAQSQVHTATIILQF